MLSFKERSEQNFRKRFGVITHEWLGLNYTGRIETDVVFIILMITLIHNI